MLKRARKQSRGARRVTALLAALLACGACTQRLYEGAKLPRSDVAMLDATGSLLWSIDGRRLYTHPLGYTRYALAPGSHSVVVRYTTPDEPSALRQAERRTSPYECAMVLLVEAGSTYHLYSRGIGLDARRQRWAGGWEAWVSRDGSDGEPIAHCVAGVGEAETRGGAAPRPTALADRAAPPAASTPAATKATSGATAPQPAAVAPHPPGPREIRVGTWNLHGLGSGRDHDVPRIAAIIAAHFDAVVLTEVHTAAASVDTSPLAAALGDDWLWLADPTEASTARERYLIGYRRSALRPCPGWEQARSYTPGTTQHFVRPPVFVCLQTPAGEAPPAFDFLLAAYRADWGDGDLSAVAAEVGQLDAVFAAMRSARPGEGDLLIAGDFNLDPDDVRPLVKAALVTRGGGSTLDLRGERTANLNDQLLVLDPRATVEMRGMAEVQDVRPANGDARAFVRTVSDHLPVVLRLDAQGRDDD